MNKSSVTSLLMQLKAFEKSNLTTIWSVGRFFRGLIFHVRENVMWHWPVSSIAVCCASGTAMPSLILLAACDATVTHNAFQWEKQPQILEISPLPWGAGPHLTHKSLGPPNSDPQMASRSAWPFLQGSWTWPTHTQTDRQHYSICINMLQVVSVAMRPNSNDN